MSSGKREMRISSSSVKISDQECLELIRHCGWDTCNLHNELSYPFLWHT